MISSTFILALFSATVPTVWSYDRDGEDWVHLQDFFTSTADNLKGKPRQEADDARGMGTWWDVTKSGGFGKVEDHLGEPQAGPRDRCGLAFYYDNMFGRARLSGSGEMGQDLTRPLAVAPVCDDGFASPDWIKDGGNDFAEYPGRERDKQVNGGKTSVVFHNSAAEGHSGDCYFCLTWVSIPYDGSRSVPVSF